MGDSDDDFDSRRNRDKFRRERDDFGGNRPNRGGGDWNDGSHIQLDYDEEDRPNQFRRQYPGSGGPPGRDFPPRYNRSPGRYDMSPPPHNKRVRRDWDGPDQPPSHFDPPGGAPYFHGGGGGGGYHSNFPPNAHQSAGTVADQFTKDTSDGTTQPPLLSFKHFLQDQDDNIDQEDAVKRYNDYKTDFKKTQIAEFFAAHKDEEWFKYKYYPDEYPKRREEQRETIKKRLDIFMELYQKGYLDDVNVDIENQRTLTRFLDAVVIKLEGGNDHDLRALDVVTSSSSITNENDDIDEDVPKQSSNVNQPTSSVKIESSTSVTETKSSESKREGEGSASDDGALSDGGDEDDDDEKKPIVKTETPIESDVPKMKQENGSPTPKLKENNEPKPSSEDNEPEAGEVPDAPRALHRTLSIFFRHLAMQATRDELENICKQYSGFRRVCITDPAPERKFSRRGWVTFDHSVQIRNICYELNSTKLHDLDVGAIINRELKNRIRTINGIGQHKTIVRNDLRLITKIIQQLDDRWNIWDSSNNLSTEKKSETTTTTATTDDSEISSSTASMVISPVKNKRPIGFVSHNPLLKNITGYLVEEADAEEEELLGDSTSQSNTFETDKDLTKVLDRLILYLRVVHSIDYYNGTEYAQEDSMPNRCGVIHVRGAPLSSITETELTNFIQQFESRLKPLIDFHEKLDDEEAIKLGAKNEEDEVEKFITANCQEVGKDKWSCPLSGKKFKGPEFVRKHILNKHQDKIDEAKKEVIYFNNYLYDSKRPLLPEHPSSRPGGILAGSHPSGLPLPTPSTPMGGQGLLNRPPMWPSMSAPAHSGHYHNNFHHHRHPRPPYMYQGPNNPMIRAPMNRQLKSYEDLDAPSEMLI